ncbi:MAG: hypothetical protein ACR2G2_06490 [Pseudonocardia sp.]
MRKICLAVAIVGATAAGTMGTALAGDDGGGSGGSATNNCLGIGINLLSGIGVLGQGVASAANCTATADGSGG